MHRNILWPTRRLFLILLCIGVLAVTPACLLGPKYHAPKPATPAAPNYKESTLNFQDTQGWKVANPQEAMLRGKWWEIFNDPELNALEDQVNINNQNIKQYFENLMTARAEIREARAQYWPTITANPSWNRSKILKHIEQFVASQYRKN